VYTFAAEGTIMAKMSKAQATGKPARQGTGAAVDAQVPGAKVVEAMKRIAARQLQQEIRASFETDTIGLKAARECLGDLVDRVRHAGTRITITKNNKPAAMLIPMDDWEILLGLMNAIDNDIVDRVLADEKADFAPYVPKRARQA
jgi:prevent-host-death family protein